MREKKQRLLKRFEGFVSGVREKDRIAILSHSDADGFCAALIACRAIERLRKKKPDMILTYHYGPAAAFERTLKKFKRSNITKALIFDINIDSMPEQIKQLEKFAEVLILDHHHLINDLNSKKTVLIKANWISGKDSDKYPASKLAFDLFNRVVDVRDLDWVAGIGILGDWQYLTWKKFVDRAAKRQRVSVRKLGELEKLIAAVESMAEKRLGSLFETFYSAETPSELAKSRMLKYVKQLSSEIEYWIKRFSTAEYLPELGMYLYKVRPKHSIKSYLVNDLSKMYPNKTIVLMRVNNSNVKISARRQDGKYKMNELLANATKRIPDASAGGHSPAAGAAISKKYLNKFEKAVIKEMRKMVKG